MRLLLVRHGESAANRRDFARMGRMAKGETEAEAGAWSAANEAAAEPNGDTFLTENGHEQVEAFGSYWAPLLQHAAQRGKLRVFCSPMRRNLQTAAPLLRQLDALGCRVVADVRRDNFEVPGMVHPADSPAMAEIQRLVASGKRAEAIALLKGHTWTPAGLSANEIAAEFPHVRLLPGDPFPADASQGWYAGGFEGPKLLRLRFSAMADWVHALRDELAEDDVVLMITHGDMQNRLLNVLLARQMGVADFESRVQASALPPDDRYLGMHPGSNTSVTLLTMNNVVAANPAVAPFNIEFMHRLDHLSGPTNTLMRGYQYLGLLPQPPSERARDGPAGYWGLRMRAARL